MEILCNRKRIAKKAKRCRNFFSRAKGLMFSRELREGEGIVLEAGRGGVLETTIHMMFVFFPIDVVWVGDDGRVVDVMEKVMPFSFRIAPKKAARYVLELPVGAGRKVKIGDKISFR
jgi:uncharacterized membrane protein (UPF0127 family)